MYEAAGRHCLFLLLGVELLYSGSVARVLIRTLTEQHIVCADFYFKSSYFCCRVNLVVK